MLASCGMTLGAAEPCAMVNVIVVPSSAAPKGVSLGSTFTMSGLKKSACFVTKASAPVSPDDSPLSMASAAGVMRGLNTVCVSQ